MGWKKGLEGTQHLKKSMECLISQKKKKFQHDKQNKCDPSYLSAFFIVLCFAFVIFFYPIQLYFGLRPGSFLRYHFWQRTGIQLRTSNIQGNYPVCNSVSPAPNMFFWSSNVYLFGLSQEKLFQSLNDIFKILIS